MNGFSTDPTGSTRRYRAWSLGVAFLAAFLVPAADACQVCIPMPVQTLADRLLEADTLVLAREDPERPFHYAPVEVLRGASGEAPIDAFLPSVDRRVLARYPQRHMLLARQQPAGDWVALGIADADFERVVRRILDHVMWWQPMETDNPQRLAEFVPLLGHRDSRLHELAYLEIGRAPYAEIRRISTQVPIETVRGMLDEPRYLEWRSLAILMLAQSERPADRQRIRNTFDDKQRLGSTFNLGAWATAYLTIEGLRGLERIQRWYLTQPDRSLEELREIVTALSVAAAADASLQEPVVTAYRALLDVHPALASDISRDLMAWRRWDFAEQVQGLRSAVPKPHPLAIDALGLYLRSAADASSSDSELSNIPETSQTPTGVKR